MNRVQELIRPDETYNQAVDVAIEREGCLHWGIRMLEEKQIERLLQKEWFAEAAYVLHRLDDICREHNIPLITNQEHQWVRSFRLFEEEGI